tara:strand:- start:260 stop:547 length:288 start_codon:yes stop_codon:yes gene_type:complete
MTRAERRRQAKKQTDNIVDITESGIFGDVPLDVRVKLALEPCEELNGKSVLDLAMMIHQSTDVDTLSDEEFKKEFDEWLKNTDATDFTDAFKGFL